MRRLAVRVPADRAEVAHARLAALAPAGWEERELTGGLELVVYGDEALAATLAVHFGAVFASEVEPGWQERWREFHRPVRVGRLWVGPPWETPPSGLTALVIEPAQAFGTGGHATTRLCLELLEGPDRGSVLDVGCGSGVLAIAAAKLGFAPVVAVDVDPQAVEATERNGADNGVVLDVRHADLRDAELPEADLALANITVDAVEELSGKLHSPRLITSGYLVFDEPSLEGYEVERRLEEAGWAADLHVRR